MPTVAKTSPAQIVAAAQKLIERGGLDAASMQAIARAVGVAGPSLYKHFPQRAAILRAVAQATVDRMHGLLQRAATTGDPLDDLRAMANAQRAFARRSPHLYSLLFGQGGDPTELAPEDYAVVVAPLLERLRLVGEPARALQLARLLVAFTHGFAAMEAAGAFRMGGDLDADFTYALDHLLATLPGRARR